MRFILLAVVVLLCLPLLFANVAKSQCLQCIDSPCEGYSMAQGDSVWYSFPGFHANYATVHVSSLGGTAFASAATDDANFAKFMNGDEFNYMPQVSTPNYASSGYVCLDDENVSLQGYTDGFNLIVTCVDSNGYNWCEVRYYTQVWDWCYQFSNCSTCNAQSICGWCASSGACLSGTASGPCFPFVCPNWYFPSCPSAIQVPTMNHTGSIVSMGIMQKKTTSAIDAKDVPP